MKPTREHPILVAFVAMAILVAVVVGRAAFEAQSELAAANSYRRTGAIAGAIEHYRRTLRWSVPFSSHAQEAALALESIARESEASGDVAGSLLAWRSLAGGLAARRFLYSGEDPARATAEEQIGRLLALHRADAIDANLSEQQLIADHIRLLNQEVSPDPLWGTLLLVGFAGWIGCLVVVIRRGFDPAGNLRWSSARSPFWGALACFVCFGLGLLFA
jgi:hypothetical protein